MAIIRGKYIRSLVVDLLEQNKVRLAPVNVEKLANNLGISIVYQRTKNDLSGFLFQDFKTNEAIIGVNKSHPENRQRFTIAHEIGHFKLHKYEGFHFDGIVGTSLKMRDENSSTGLIKEEREANFFASELLMPLHFIQRDIVNFSDSDLLFDNDLPKLARKYKVSVRSLTFRLANLGFIPL